MPFLIAAVVLVGLLCVLDLVLTLGVLRRLREHSDLLTDPGRATTDPAQSRVGETVGDFRTTTVHGEPVSGDTLPDGTVVAFFTPGCEPCERELPRFATHARSVPAGRDAVLAVIVGAPQEAREYVAVLASVARVVVEDPLGPVAAAFNTTAFPTLLRIGRDGQGQLAITADRVDLRPPLPVPA
ncbi:TlpA disulfide reductase family protein [Micromonospora sp. NPDC047557]|uniref:TlpA disulfide reductase family protein n=1 Tax=Micromonospora sp. NPDC047557 TaxID=3364250 RepID=UPI00371F17AF